MFKLIVVLACLLSLFSTLLADVEYEHHGHGHHHSHDGHDHHDHESHRKLFADGSDNEGERQQRDRLRLVAKKIDTNGDESISQEEMRVYVRERVEEQNRREADEFISNLDPNNEKKITFKAYVDDNFGQVEIEGILNAQNLSPHSREIRRTYLADKAKWDHLDKDKDGSLSYEDFRKFLRPENDRILLDIETNSMITEYDSDKDGKISNDEYRVLTDAETGHSESLSEELDINGDGFATTDEFARYYWPSEDSNVNEETAHLMKECDVDRDGFCSHDEIVNAYSSFAGSQVTDYGADLESDHEEL